MQVEEVCIPFPVAAKHDPPLFTSRRLLAYLTEGILEDSHASREESFWLIALTQERRPILRQRLKLGHLVAARVNAREIFEAAFDAGAEAIACARVQQTAAVQPGLADGRLLWNLVEASKCLNVLFVDYLITQLNGCAYYSYQEHRRVRD